MTSQVRLGKWDKGVWPVRTDRSLQAWVQAGQKWRLPTGGGENRAEHLGKRMNSLVSVTEHVHERGPPFSPAALNSKI